MYKSYTLTKIEFEINNFKLLNLKLYVLFYNRHGRRELTQVLYFLIYMYVKREET